MAFDHARGGNSIPPRSGSASRPRRNASVSRGRSGSAASQPPPLHGNTVIVGGGGNGGAGGDAGSPRAAYQQARAQMQELEKDYQQAKESEGAARSEVRQMRGRLEAKEDEVRKLNLRVLQLSDAMDAAALQGEEEKHELRKQVEAESRSYRARAHNTKQLVAQLRQDALEAKVRYDDLKHGYDRAMESSERLHTELMHYEQKAAEESTRAAALDRRLSDASTQQQLWDTAEKTWVERVGRAEALVVEMERETAELARENESLRGENEGLQIAVEEQRLEILQLQKKEGDVRASLVEAASAADMLVATRRQHGELAAREQEHLDLIKELRLEKQKMMAHLQAGIKERQAVIDSLTHGDIKGANPQLQMKIVEAEALKAELIAIVQRNEEETSTVQEYTAVLKAKADASDEKMKAFRDDNRRLRAELELTKSEIQDVHAERDRACRVADELHGALNELAHLRDGLQLQQRRQEDSLQSKVDAARSGLFSQSPARLPSGAVSPYAVRAQTTSQTNTSSHDTPTGAAAILLPQPQEHDSGSRQVHVCPLA